MSTEDSFGQQEEEDFGAQVAKEFQEFQLKNNPFKPRRAADNHYP